MRTGMRLPLCDARVPIRETREPSNETQGRNAAFMRQSQPPTPLLPAKAGVPFARVHGPNLRPNPGLEAFPRPTAHRRAFSMIEILVVVALLSVIVLGLMAMFNQTQRAFRLGMSQTDVLQSGRMATELITREIGQTTLSYVDRTNIFDAVTNQTPNFDSQVVNFTLQSLPGSAAFRTNIMDDVFFLVRENQTWKGIGYFVRTNRADDPDLPGGVGPAGTLYRFETNDTVAQFQANPGGLFSGFNFARRWPFNAATNGVSKVVEGVVHFRIRPFDTSGWMIPNNPSYSTNWPYSLTNLPALVSSNLFIDFNYQYYPAISGEYGLYSFFSNAVPAAVEMELGVLEQQVYDQYKSIPILSAQQAFLTNQAPHVHLFRQHIPIRTVDPTAYSTNAF
jgi:prepilin-type N-terminal cleavage/methylation domain-containing protein